MATLNLPGWGYGLRCELLFVMEGPAHPAADQYGIFKQLISNSGEQLEAPDPWLDRESVSGPSVRL